MKNHQIQDERILQERRKIQSTAYAWIVLALLLSIIVQQFFMKAPFAQFAVELFILIGCGFYNIVCNMKKGIDIWNPSGYGKKKILLNAAASAVLSVILLIFLSGDNDVANLTVYFAAFVICYFAVHIVMAGIMHKKQRDMDRKLDKEEKE